MSAQGERFVDTKKRIQERIGVADKDFARYKFTLVTSGLFKQPSPVEDGECRGHLPSTAQWSILATRSTSRSWTKC